MGQFWFNVAVAYRNGTQVPADINRTPPQQKVIIDTQKPAVRITSAERIGDELSVSWEIQEPNADLGSLKVEYRPTEAASGTFWVAAPASQDWSVASSFIRTRRIRSRCACRCKTRRPILVGPKKWLAQLTRRPSHRRLSPITTVAAPNVPPSGVHHCLRR